MSTFAQLNPPNPAIDLALYRQLKARALMLALAGQCRTPLDAVRFVLAQLQTAELKQAEAALRTRS